MKKIIIVTGASSGMGYEFVHQINEKVDEIWVIARRTERLEKLKKFKKNIRSISLDLTNTNDLEQLKKLIEKEKPIIKILGNFSGYGKFDHSENIPLDIKLNMIDLNIKAYVSMMDYCIPYMKEESKILNMVSDSAFQPIPYINCYAATKAFLLSYTRALNQELKYKKIHVLAVCPFWVKTEFFNRAAINNKKEVIIKYTAMYDKEKVIKKAIRDLYSNKDMSVYGFINNLQMLGSKLVPHKLVMKIWMHQQKFNGTRDIR